MATKTSKVKVALEASGGNQVSKELDRVGKSTERVGKQQTRLGQASASAGRSFAAQSQGLGGVVGVYAAAAANVFALTAAFTALNRAAQFETILRGTESLANAVGTNANSVVKSLKNITDGQLSVIEAATQANLALSAGFNVDQIEQLGEVALKASRALGRNLTDSFQRITRGAIKLEPELLDEIGIFTRIEPAVEAYAASINKSASQLTQFERRQAFVTQVIKDGQAAFQDIADQGESTQEVFEALVANFTDLALVVGKTLADALVPFARFLDQNLGNRLALLGGVGLLVFGRLRTAITSFAVEGLATLGAKLSSVADGFSRAAQEASNFNATAAGKEVQGAFVGGGALPGAGRAYGAELKRQLGEGLTTQQALIAQKEIPQLLENELNTRKAIQENIDNGVGNQKKLNAELDKSNVRSAALNKSMSLVNTQLAASSKSSVLFATGLNLAAAAAQKLGAFLAGALTALNIFVGGIFAIQLVGSLFDADFIGFLTEKYKEFTAESRRTKDGLDAIASSATQASPIFQRLAISLGGTADQINSALRDAIKAGEQPIDLLEANLEALQDRLEKLTTGNFFERILAGDLLKDDAEEIAQLEQAIRTLTAATDPAVRSISEAALVVGTLAEKSDVARDSLGKAVTEGLLNVNDATGKVTVILKDGILELGKYEDGTLKLRAGIEAGAAVSTDFATKLDDLNKKLQSGQISADKAGSSFGVLANQAVKAAELLRNAGFAKEADLVLASLDAARDSTGEVVDRVTELNQLSKNLAKTFGSAFKAVDDATISGVFSSSGEFAKSTEEAAKNQSLLLQSLVKQVRTEQALRDVGEGSTSTQAELNELKTLESQIVKATEGNQLKLLNTLEKQRIAEEKKTTQLQNQVKVLQQQNKVASINLDISKLQGALSVQQANDKRTLDNSNASLKIRQETLKNNEKLLDSTKTLLEFELRRNQALQKARDAEISLQDVRARAASQGEIRSAQTSLDIMEERGISSSKELLAARLKVQEKTTNLELQTIQQKEQAAIREYEFQTQVVDDRLSLLEKEFEIEDKKRANAIELIKEEERIAKARTDQETAAITAQRKIIARQVDAAVEQKNTAILQAKIAKDSRLADITLQQNQAQLVKDRITADKLILGENVKIVNGYLRAASLLTGRDVPMIEIDATGINTANIDSIITELGNQATAVTDIYEGQKEAAQLAQNTAIASLNAQLDKLAIEETGINDSLDRTKALNKEKIKGIEDERAIAQFILDAKIKAADLEKGAIADALILKLEQAGIEREVAIAALNRAKESAAYQESVQARFDSALAASKGIVNDYVSGGLMELNDALIEGTFTFKDLTRGFREMLQNMLKDIQRAVFQKTISEPIAKGISDFLPKLFAAGGLAHLAGGGSMKRDRVAAMLEPGEFVIRKEAAKKLGMSQLQKMNAGVEPDPLARLIAMFSGSKVVQKRAGGGLTAGEVVGAVTDDDALGFLGKAAFGKVLSTAIPQLAVPLALMGGLRAASRVSSAASMKKTTAGTRLTREQFETIYGTGSMGGAPTSAAMATRMNLAAGLAATPGFSSVAESLGRGEGGGGTDFGIGGNMAAATSPSGSFGAKDSTGGARRFAAGGSVSSRDRVPALLEPGEFVIRRPMAKAIGGAALNQMNATGTPPQISVNLNNSGAPKDVQVAAPRMNGDKIILDIITRDLRNNGAIKKSLRRNR